MFIVFEGIDGGGKSTQSIMLYTSLVDQGMNVLLTREPGGTAVGEKLRKSILHDKSLSDISRLLMIVAMRREHYHGVILPALNEGKIVICDRFIYSTFVYQGCASGIDLNIIKDLHSYADCLVYPELTILLNSRFSKRRRDYFEAQSDSYLGRVSQGYEMIAREMPNVFLIKPGQKEEVHTKILSIVQDKISEKQSKVPQN